MGLDHAINIDDLRKLAKRRLPKIAYDFIEGGLEDERGIARNESAFAGFDLVPRYGIDVSACDQSTILFGRTYSGPLGIAPTGSPGCSAPVRIHAGRRCQGGERALHHVGLGHGVDRGPRPAGTRTRLVSALPRARPQISEDMIRRARDAGLSTLVITVDVPINSKRERNLRNGFTRPLKMTMKTKLEALLHPGWMAEYLRTGMPMFSNWQQYAPPGASTAEVADFVARRRRCPCSGATSKPFRRLWPGKLVIKGIMHADDATRCAALGCDGIMVSNHGGRQLDKSPAPIEVLPAIAAAVGDKLTVMFDSGIRRGSDAVVALCLGAKYVFVGRATLYGAAAGGITGAVRALDIFKDEIGRTMMQMGAPDIRSLGPQFLTWDSDDRRNTPPAIAAHRA